ncbi:MAG: DUF2815 family protein [Negativicutes bacterium]|nr:DUF2815 family protein [Negativicutes bacterium]
MGNQQANNTEVVTGEVRLSYVNLCQAFARPGQDPKFSTTILLPKADVATKQRIDAAINAAIQKGVSDKWNGVRPPVLGIPIHDGDGVRPSDGMPFGAECKGHWVFTASASATRKPEVVDMNMNPIINQSEIYSGMYGRVAVNFFPYNQNGKKGIGCGLGPVQKLRDGETLAGGISAAQAFGGAPAQPQQQFATPAQPQQPQYQAQYQMQPTAPTQTYTPAPQYQAPVAPAPQQQYAAPAQPQAIDPITGLPVQPPVMGL